MLVEKQDGSFCLVVNCCDQNKATRIDSYLLPNVQETISLLGQAKYSTVVGMASGYWQISMNPGDKDKAAFNTPSENYKWSRMPIGLVNSAAAWQTYKIFHIYSHEYE